MGVVEEEREKEEGFEWEWNEESLAILREIAESEHWITLPDKFDIHEWSMMQQYADEMAEPLASTLNRPIHGKGAFRHFRAVLDDRNATDDWYSFKHEALVDIVRTLLDAEKIPHQRGHA